VLRQPVYLLWPAALSSCLRGEYLYAPQADIVIGSGGVIAPGAEIDLSSQASVDGVNTAFTWYNSVGAVVTPTTADGGKFTISESITFYWDSYRRGFGFGRFDFSNLDAE